MIKTSLRLLSTVLLGTWMLFANGCDGFVIPPQKIQPVNNSRLKLTVLVPEHELVFTKRAGFKNEVALAGIDFDLVQKFSDFAGYELTILPFPTRENALAAFQKGNGDLLIGRWPAHRSVPGTMNGPIFESSKLALYCPKKMNISHAKDLSGILISMRSVDRSAFENLKSPLYPNFQIQEILKEDASIFPTILSKNSGCAIIEERLGDFEKKFYPQIEKVYTFGFDVGLAWKIREGNTDLFNSLRRWFQLASRQDLVVPIIYRYTNALDALTDQDYLTFQKNTQARLKEYLELFRSSAQKAKIPWTLLAAVGYQESHLDNSAISHTGVQGLMQITQSTANFLGLEDRNNAQDAIPAAARYLGWIYSQWPIEAPYLERVKLTLASYNMGYQHVRDVQNWLIKKELNPYLWKHLKMGFEAKADQDLAQQFAWGNARGHETIHFVNRVLAFESLFKRKYTRSSIQQYLKETK